MMLSTRISIALSVGFFVGLLAGWLFYRPSEKPLESYAPPVRQEDGSLMLERNPDAKPPAAPHALPKGAKEERRVSVVVKPPKGRIMRPNVEFYFADVGTPPSDSQFVRAVKESLTADSCDCQPVTVDLSLVRMPDKTRRVVASSPTGQILSGIDIPIESPTIPRTLLWAIGGTYSFDGAHRFGGFVDRDIGPFRLGVEAFQSPTGWTAQARAGIRF